MNVKYEASVTRPFAQYQETKSFDTFQQAAEWLCGIARELAEIPKNLMQYSLNSMTITETTENGRKTVWAEATQGMKTLSA